jgi:hypothetical protein
MTSFEKSQARFVNILLSGQEGMSSFEWIVSGGWKGKMNRKICQCPGKAELRSRRTGW